MIAVTSRWPTARLLARAAALPWQASPTASAAGFGISALTGAVPALAAYVMKLLIDTLTAGRSADHSRAYTLALIGAALGGLLLISGYVTGYLSGVIQARVVALAQRRLYERIAAFQGLAQFERAEFLDRLQLAERSVESSPSGVSSFLISAIRQAAGSVTYVVILLTIWSPIALLLLAVAVPAAIAQHRLAGRAAGGYASTAELYRRRDYFRTLATDPDVAKEARIFGLTSLFRKRMGAALQDLSSVELGHQRRLTVTECKFALGAVAVAITAALIAVRGVLSGNLGIGDFTLFVAGVAAVQSASSSITAQYGYASMFVRMFKHYLDIIDAPPDLMDGPQAPLPLETSIEFRDVWFRYEDGPWVLRGLNLRLPVGLSTAIVGVNGAGKSTLVKLLMRFYDPEVGTILWDGIDIKQFSIAQLRSRFSATFQDFARYELTARENIGIGLLSAEDELPELRRIRDAAELAGADGFLGGLTAGYDTTLSRRFVDDGAPGTSLSGGQWQRIAIARSLLRTGADLLILDEPSSGLDAASEHEIHRAISQHGARTQVLISHRLSALRNADQIVVIEAGEVTELGPHDTLIGMPGSRYAELFIKQAAGYQLDPAGELATVEE